VPLDIRLQPINAGQQNQSLCRHLYVGRLTGHNTLLRLLRSMEPAQRHPLALLLGWRNFLKEGAFRAPSLSS
jgi:hypothetical protein